MKKSYQIKKVKEWKKAQQELDKWIAETIEDLNKSMSGINEFYEAKARHNNERK